MAKISNFNEDYIGLVHTEIAENKEMFGRNDFITPMPDYDIKYFAKSALRPIVIVLLLCSIICFFEKSFPLGFASIVIALLYVVSNFAINKKISKDAQTMQNLSARFVKVVRSGELTEIPSYSLLPGDIIYLTKGDTVPCDCTVCEQNDLTVDEAILTGVHISVIKNAEIDNSDNKLKANYLYSGSVICSGEVVAKVFAIGSRSLCVRNDIVKMKPALRPNNTEKKAFDFAHKLELVSVILFAICFFVMYFIKGATNASGPAIYSASLAISLVPAFIPLIISALTNINIDALKKEKRHIINYNTFEKAGDIDVICVDKTGIITANELSIADIYTENKSMFAHISTLACDKNNPSALDNIILNFCEEVGADVPIIQSNYLLHTFPFKSEEKMSAFVWRMGDDSILCAKGSPEEILHICKLSDTDRLMITAKQEEFAKKGYSVIAVAFKELPKDKPLASAISKENGLNFAGLYAINDPPRDSITDAVEICKSNGIKLLMITGDNPDTALTVATSIGLDTKGGIVSGEEIEYSTNEEIAELIEKTDVFARVSPDIRLKIVNVLKSMGKKVCIVGENESDVSILKSADVGVCIGKEPSEYAKEACDIWIENNSLDEITDTVIFCKKNKFAILRSVAFAVSMQFALFISTLCSLLFASKSNNVQAEFLPAGILFIEAFVFFLCVGAFAVYNGKYAKPIKNHNIFSLVPIVINTLVTVIVTFLAYKLFLNSAHLDNISTNIVTAFGHARCFALCTFSFIIGFSAFAYITEDLFAIVSFIKSIKKPLVIATTVISIVTLILIAFVPSVGSVFGVAPIPLPAFLLSIALALIPSLTADILKTFKK